MRFLSLALVGVSAVANPCASIGERGRPVRIAGEEAIIVWDEQTHTESFIRTARFETDAPSLGFLVPTPTVPRLKQTSDRAFGVLNDIVSPRPAAADLPMTKGARAANRVDIVSRQRVGDYDATILKGSDPGAVKRWLAQNGYPTSPLTEAWLKPYLRKGWAITAFHLSRVRLGRAHLPPVALTFSTDRPFYPYREPENGSADGRKLRIYLLADRAFHSKEPWPGKVDFQRELEGADAERLRSSLGDVAGGLANKPFLTAFLDDSSPRIGREDLTFAPDSKPPYAIGVGAFAGIGALLYVLRPKRT